jgi:broad-specificity NMP kinase
VKRILITGMSGTGKSTVVAELAARGHHAIDLDTDTWSEWVQVDGNPTGANSGHDWLWNETKLAMLLAEGISQTLFVSGCASNMGKFVRCFDDVVLLSAPIGVMLDRVRLRTNNPYGKQDVEIAQIKENVRRFEPRLRLIASQEIDTSLPIRDVLEKFLKLQ